jgi:hypothetical protein
VAAGDVRRAGEGSALGRSRMTRIGSWVIRNGSKGLRPCAQSQPGVRRISSPVIGRWCRDAPPCIDGLSFRRASPFEESRHRGFDLLAGVVPFPLLLAGISGPLDPLPLKGFFPDPHDHRRIESGGEASISRTKAVTKSSGRSSRSRTSAGVAGERTEIQRRARFDPDVARGRLRHDHATPCHRPHPVRKSLWPHLNVVAAFECGRETEVGGSLY